MQRTILNASQAIFLISSPAADLLQYDACMVPQT
jgi:hypothetical protein